MKRTSIALMVLAAAGGWAADVTESPAPAPTVDRVVFPRDYAEKFQPLRFVNKTNEMKIVTVYGNDLAASVTNSAGLPYPSGSVIVMETAGAAKDGQGKPVADEHGHFRKDAVLGLHVMRKETGFGAEYGPNRSGEWEYAEYRANGEYITPPRKSFACAQCHVKAGAAKDFVYRGRF
jgi:hypothetical protein